MGVPVSKIDTTKRLIYHFRIGGRSKKEKDRKEESFIKLRVLHNNPVMSNRSDA